MIIYEILSTILFIILMPLYYIVRVSNGKYLYGWREKLGFFKNPDLGSKVIMYHGVSVGEIIALENLIKKTKEVFPDYKLVVTTGTKTGQDIAQKKYTGIADYVTYFPYDISFCNNRFLDKIKPSVVLIAETEIWPDFAYKCKKRGISLFIINGRISDSTYNLYKKLKIFFKPVLENYTGILTQSNEDNEKLISVGAPKDRTRVMKNLKFDVKQTSETVDMKNGSSRIIIAGSTHKGEDEIVLNAFKNLKQEFPDIKLLLVPRHTQRVQQIQDLAAAAGLSYGLRSKNDLFTNNEIIILDTMGELGKMYSICHFAFIGGSFNNTGGHNPLEAAVYSKPVVSGPSIHNFKDIYWLLGRSDAGKIVNTPDELEDYMRLLLNNKNFYTKACNDCRNIFEEQKGALNVIIDTLKALL